MSVVPVEQYTALSVHDYRFGVAPPLERYIQQLDHFRLDDLLVRQKRVDWQQFNPHGHR